MGKFPPRLAGIRRKMGGDQVVNKISDANLKEQKESDGDRDSGSPHDLEPLSPNRRQDHAPLSEPVSSMKTSSSERSEGRSSVSSRPLLTRWLAIEAVCSNPPSSLTHPSSP